MGASCVSDAPRFDYASYAMLATNGEDREPVADRELRPAPGLDRAVLLATMAVPQ
jgi:hypothetical protein